MSDQPADVYFGNSRPTIVESSMPAFRRPQLLTKKAWEDRLPGGLGDKKKPGDFSPGQLAKGKKVEQEHTSDKHLPTEIAMDHLSEDPKYYDKLESVEKRAFFEELAKIAVEEGYLEKEAFQTSMYSGPLSYGGFKMESSNPGFRMPQMLRKQAATPLTPAGRLVNSSVTAKVPKMSVAGPSIADQAAKPPPISGSIAMPKLPGAKKGPAAIT
jgi:hypothetical protein